MAGADVHILHLRPGHEAIARRAVEQLKVHGILKDATYFTDILKKEENLLLVAMEDDDPVGFLLGYSMPRIDRPHPMMLLYEIEVAESHRQRGIGRRLLEGFLEWCRREDAAIAWCMTQSTNGAARHLYTATGAEEVDIGDVMLYEWPKI